MASRLDMVLSQLNPTPTHAEPMPDDIVLVRSKRTALGRARKGVFNNTTAPDLLSPVLKNILQGLDPAIVSDVVVGSVLGNGSIRASECRMACFLAGMKEECSVRVVNRQCSSGLQAIADVAAAIRAGYYDVGIAAGVETMSLNSMAAAGKGLIIPDTVKACGPARDCLLPMGITSENVAEKFGVTREEQDRLAVMSNARAAAAKHKFRAEIVPVLAMWKDPKSGKKSEVLADHDDGVRVGTTMESLSKLRTVFKKTGTTTAGNASQMTDGASACLMMKRSTASRLGLRPLARFAAYSVVGVTPSIMGIGPAAAIPAVLEKAGMSTTDIDLWEINEAFASQAVYCVKKLGLNWDNVNVNGGAIAIGHPLGCTGVRMATTLIYEMTRRGDKRGVVSMCIGSGMGAAGIFERI